MFTRIREYVEFRKNKRIVKRELAQMAAATLPVMREISDKGTNLMNDLTVSLANLSAEDIQRNLVHFLVENIPDHKID